MPLANDSALFATVNLLPLDFGVQVGIIAMDSRNLSPQRRNRVLGSGCSFAQRIIVSQRGFGVANCLRDESERFGVRHGFR
jgi:hypothetical protein